MRICPQCRTSYTDDSLQFCLQDGTPLAPVYNTSDNSGEAETVISPNQRDKMRVDIQNPQPTFTGSTERFPTAETAAPRKSNTGLIVVLTMLVTLFGVAAVVFGLLYYKRGEKTEVAQNTNSKPANPTPNTSKTNQTANINAANTNATPTATATPAPTLNSKEVEKISSDVKNVVENWKDATENFDLDSNLGNYGDTVDYYNAGKVSAATVRTDKQRAFEAYSSISIDISNLKVAPDNKGESATVIFDKEWNFEGESKNSTGKVQQQLQLNKIGGKWRITGEKDLKVYYVNN